MKLFVRADASSTIGTGHLMRCLALAEECAGRGADVRFFLRPGPGDLIGLVKEKGHPVTTLPTPETTTLEKDMEETRAAMKKKGGADWLIIDLPEADGTFDSALRDVAGKILVIDDLALAARDYDALLNQNYFPGVERRYEMLAPPNAFHLLGPRYALLRTEFRAARTKARTRTGPVRRILVSFGGGGGPDEAATVIGAVRLLQLADVNVDVVAGPSTTNAERIEFAAVDLDEVTVHRSVEDMASLTAQADIAIGAYGVSTLERMLVGTPALIITIADIQEPPAEALASDGYARYLGRSAGLTADDIARAVSDVMNDPAWLVSASRRGMELVDGLGAQRAADTLFGK